MRILFRDVADCNELCKPVAAALAVSLTIGLMVALNLVHPPSGATALFIVYAGISGHRWTCVVKDCEILVSQRDARCLEGTWWC
jgi:hypothetical protein